MNLLPDAAEARRAFVIAKGWEARSRLLLQWAERLPAVLEERDEDLVQGCESRVRLTHEAQGERHFFRASSESRVLKGLLAVVLLGPNALTREALGRPDIHPWLGEPGLEQQWPECRAHADARTGGLAFAGRRLAPRAEEVGQHLAAGLGQHPTLHQHPVVEKILLEKAPATLGHAGTRLAGTIDQALDATVDDEAGAHAAGFERHIEGRARQPVVGQPRGGVANRLHLGMGTGIVSTDGPIEAAAYDLAVEHYHGADRHLALSGALLRQGQGLAHEQVIPAAVDDGQGAEAGHD